MPLPAAPPLGYGGAIAPARGQVIMKQYRSEKHESV
jgi:hypothetical protein